MDGPGNVSFPRRKVFRACAGEREAIMKKIGFKAMLGAAAMAFIAASCSNGGGTGSLSVAANVPRSALSERAAGETGYTMTLTMTGAGDEQSRTAQSLAVTEESVEFEPIVYDELPVGATVEISAELKAGGTVIAKGSGSATIERGENTATIRISDVREWFVLWNKGDSENSSTGLTKGIQVFQRSELKDGLSVTKALEESNDFCFDDSGNLYVLAGGKIIRYKATRTSGYEKSAVYEPELENAGGLQFCDGKLWLIWPKSTSGGENTTHVYSIDFDKKSAEEKFTIGTYAGIYTVVGGFLYLYNGATDKVSKYAADGSLVVESESLEPASHGGSFYVKQLYSQDGIIYALFQCAGMDISSKGGVYRINPDTLATTSTIGWTDEGIEKDSTKFLFAPRKVIARRPKKLIIADDGCYYEGSYTNMNRVVEIDLETEALTSVTPVGVMFDAKTGGCGLEA